MTKDEKEVKQYLDGLVVLFHIINHDESLDKASDVLHDILLRYNVVEDNKDAFKKGYEDVKELFIDMPRSEDPFFNKNDVLMRGLDVE